MRRRATIARQLVTSGNNVRQSIFEAALDLFCRQSYDATGIKQIVDQAGVSKGAFYHYWPSKEQLLVEIHDVFARYAAGVARSANSSDNDPVEIVRALMRGLLRQVELYLQHMTIFFQESRKIPYEKYPDSRRLRDEFEQALVQALERGAADGSFQPDLESMPVVAYGIVGMCVYSYQWFTPRGTMRAEEIGDMYSRVLVYGLLNRSGGS